MTEIETNGYLAGYADDIDQDGFTDLLLTQHYNGSGHNGDGLILWGSLSGDLSLDASTVLAHGSSNTLLPSVIADFNGDGQKDIFLGGYHVGSSWSNQTYSAVYWGASAGFDPSMKDEWPIWGVWYSEIVGNPFRQQ